jgi:hypothetical protein
MSDEAFKLLERIFYDLCKFLELYNHRKIRRFHKYISKLYFKESLREFEEFVEELDSNDYY